jgi:hypothetical protein
MRWWDRRAKLLEAAGKLAGPGEPIDPAVLADFLGWNIHTTYAAIKRARNEPESPWVWKGKIHPLLNTAGRKTVREFYLKAKADGIYYAAHEVAEMTGVSLTTVHLVKTEMIGRGEITPDPRAAHAVRVRRFRANREAAKAAKASPDFELSHAEEAERIRAAGLLKRQAMGGKIDEKQLDDITGFGKSGNPKDRENISRLS